MAIFKFNYKHHHTSFFFNALKSFKDVVELAKKMLDWQKKETKKQEKNSDFSGSNLDKLYKQPDDHQKPDESDSEEQNEDQESAEKQDDEKQDGDQEDEDSSACQEEFYECLDDGNDFDECIDAYNECVD